MTPRMSMRARAREVYGELAPSSLRFDGQGENKEASRAQPDLTSRARDLYENSAVPVREIARIIGVTERTIYKYVAKGGWKKRYRVSPDCAPAKGAGGRFIRREDIGKPFATGLKATDPAGRERALVACRRAKSLSRAAQAKAAQEARDAEFLRALAFNARCLGDLRRHREVYVKGPPSALQLRIESLLIDSVEWSFRRLQGFVPPRPAVAEPPRPVTAVAAPVPKPVTKPPAPRFDPDDYRAWL